MSTQKAILDMRSTGSISIWVGSTSNIPEDWLYCNGASLDRSTYTDLFAIIGTKFGAVDGSHFNIPDMRGLFIRGVNDGRDSSTGDPNAASRDYLCSGGCCGDNPGSFQADGYLTHSHIIGSNTGNTKPNVHTWRNCGAWFSSTGCNYAQTTRESGESSNESRAKNLAVYWIIKI